VYDVVPGTVVDTTILFVRSHKPVMLPHVGIAAHYCRLRIAGTRTAVVGACCPSLPSLASVRVAQSMREGSPLPPGPFASAPNPGAVAAFVELVLLKALLGVEARFLESSVTAIEHPKRLQHDHAPTDDHHLAVTRMSQSAPRRKRAQHAALKIESEMRSPPPTPRGRLSPLLSPTHRDDTRRPFEASVF